MEILLVAATEGEISPLLQHLQQTWQQVSTDSYKNGEISVDICITGVGMVATTYNLVKKLAANSYDFALQAGVAGSFAESIPLGETVFITSDQFGDLGAEDHYNFLDIFELGLLEKNGTPYNNGKLIMLPHALHNNIKLRQVCGLTVNSVSGNAYTIAQRKQKFNCEVESMEGAAFHFVCLKESIPFAQVRSISNYVIPRDKSQWQMKDAIINLNKWLIDFLKVL